MQYLKFLSLIFIINYITISQTYNWVEKHYKENESEKFDELVRLDDGNLYAVANHASIIRLYKSRDNGNNWIKIYEKDHLPIFDPSLQDSVWNLGECSIIDSNNFFLSYYDSNVIDITNDGGNTFRRIALKGIFNSVKDINMFNKEIGIATTEVTIAVTFDGWLTHNIYYFDRIGYRKVNYYLDSLNLAIQKYRVGGGYGFENFNLKTGIFTELFDDGYPNDSTFQVYLTNAYFVNKNLGFGIGTKTISPKPGAYLRYEQVLKTTNGGRSWKIIYESDKAVANSYRAIVFFDENHGLRCENGRWSESFDGGYTWLDGYVQEEFGRGFSPNLICIDTTAIFANNRIYRWEEVNEDIEKFYFKRIDSSEYCYNSDKIWLKDVINVEDGIIASSRQFVGDGIEWVTINNDDNHPMSGKYFFPNKVPPGDNEITYIHTNKARYSVNARIRDTTIILRVNGESSNKPIIYNFAGDTLFTQFESVDWYRAEDMLYLSTGKSYVAYAQIGIIAIGKDENGCDTKSELFDFQKSDIELEDNLIKIIGNRLYINKSNFNDIKSLELYNVQGMLIEKFDLETVIDFNNNLRNGIYFLKILTNKEVFVHKVILQN